MTDRVELLTPAVRPPPPFPKIAGITLGVAVLLCFPLSPDQPLPLVVLFGIAYTVALLAAWSMAAWAEESLYLRYVHRSTLERTLVALAVPIVAGLLSVPVAILGAPLTMLGDNGVVSTVLLTGAWWLGLAGVGSLVVVLLDVSASALAKKFRSRLILAILGLVVAVGALVFFITNAGDSVVDKVLASVDKSATWEIQLSGEPIHAAAAELIGPAEARIIRTLLWCIAALFSVPIIVSATAKLADAIMERLHPLARGFRAIQGGDFGVRVEEAGSEDFVVLNKSFNSMVSSLALSWRMERAFGLYVGKHVLGRIRAQHGEATVPATSKRSTVLFGDIRGFTAMSEKLQPAEVLGILNRYFERVVTIIDEHEGFLNKFVGDAVVVVFNGPLDQDDHAVRAARCAIAIQRQVEAMNLDGAFKEVGGLKVGIGIATGPVVAGNLGGAEQMEYTVIGDTVNLAARLTSKAPGGEVWINEAMALELPRELKVEALEPITVKGKAKPLTPYRLWPARTPTVHETATVVGLNPRIEDFRRRLEATKRPLGTSGLELTSVGFGSWAVGGGGWSYGWGAQSDAESVAAIRHALTLGVNWIDTAAVYGLGHAEEVVQKALAETPVDERPLIFTKCGLVGNHKRPFDEPMRDLRPKALRKECEASLQRLGVGRIDLYQIHWPAGPTPAIEDSWGELSRLQSEGKIRALGVSNFDVDFLERCERIHHVDSLQPPFSLIRRKAALDVIPWALAHGTGVIVYSPMQAGLLTDRFRADRVAVMGDDDWRRKSSDFKPPRLSQNLALRDALKPIAVRHKASIAAVAVAWTLAWQGVTGAIVGARSAAQVDGWIDAADLVLTAQDLDEIAAAIAQTNAGMGPGRP